MAAALKDDTVVPRSEFAAHADGEVAAHDVFALRDIDATRVSGRSGDIRRDGIEGVLHVEKCRQGRAVVQGDLLGKGEVKRGEGTNRGHGKVICPLPKMPFFCRSLNQW